MKTNYIGPNSGTGEGNAPAVKSDCKQKLELMLSLEGKLPAADMPQSSFEETVTSKSYEKQCRLPDRQDEQNDPIASWL
jgi:hypothetical protein